MGIELDVLVGHPEHDLLFVATQVARAAGLKQPANSASAYRRVNKAGMALMTLIQDGCIRLEDIPADERDQRRLPDGSVQLSSLTALSAASLPKVTGALQWRDALRVLDSVQDSPNANNRVQGPLG